MSAAGHEAPEGNGAAGEKPEGAVGETGEVQRAGTKKINLASLLLLQPQPGRMSVRFISVQIDLPQCCMRLKPLGS